MSEVADTLSEPPPARGPGTRTRTRMGHSGGLSAEAVTAWASGPARKPPRRRQRGFGDPTVAALRLMILVVATVPAVFVTPGSLNVSRAAAAARAGDSEPHPQGRFGPGCESDAHGSSST